MVLELADNRDPRSWASRLRQRRIALFERLIAPLGDPVRVLDVGGAPGFWRGYRQGGGRRLRVTLLNLERDPEGEDFEQVVADARDLGRFADKSFDACFSNSLIEHVGTFFDQQKVAAEIGRLAPIYFVQTPNRAFPLEAHFLMPGFQYLPVTVRTMLHRRFRMGWVERQPDPILARAEIEQLRLLSHAELARLFPDARILRETIGPLTKSLIAVRAPDLETVLPADGRL
ncbi:MAG: methyltransferase domain-containing protein [Polyangiales bacterium]